MLVIGGRGDRQPGAEQARPRTRSSSRSAVELRQGEIRGSLPQLTTLPPELLQLGHLIRCQPGPDTLTPLSLPNPLTQRLGRTPEQLPRSNKSPPTQTGDPHDAPKPSDQPAPEPPTNTMSVYPYPNISQPIESPENPGGFTTIHPSTETTPNKPGRFIQVMQGYPSHTCKRAGGLRGVSVAWLARALLVTGFCHFFAWACRGLS